MTLDTSYAYDGGGLRASKTVGGTASPETWDVAEGLPLLLQDGSTRGLADADGTITDSYSYDPYGQRSVVTGSASDTPFGYAGQYTDAESGLQYLRARYYDPDTGQFQSARGAPCRATPPLARLEPWTPAHWRHHPIRDCPTSRSRCRPHVGTASWPSD